MKFKKNICHSAPSNLSVQHALKSEAKQVFPTSSLLVHETEDIPTEVKVHRSSQFVLNKANFSSQDLNLTGILFSVII